MTNIIATVIDRIVTAALFFMISIFAISVISENRLTLIIREELFYKQRSSLHFLFVAD